MIKKKGCFLLLSCIIFLSCLSVVSAADADNNTIYEANDDTSDNVIDTADETAIDIDENEIDEDNMDFSNEENDLDYLDDNIDSQSTSTNYKAVSYSYNGILKGANTTKNYVLSNHALPATVTIDGKQVDMNNLLYLMCRSVNQTGSVTINQEFSHVSSTYGTNCDNVMIPKTDYIKLSNSIIKYYDVNKHNPKKLALNNQTINFDDTIYLYSRIIAWKYNNNGALPSHGLVDALYNIDYSSETNAPITTSSQSFTINTSYTKLSGEKYSLTLKPSTQCTIYYTVNGSTPTSEDSVYTQPLKIKNKTWVRFYGVNKNNERTPVLSFGMYRPAITYITNKAQTTDGYNYVINLASSHDSTVYYTVNGRKPTTKSTQYTKPITINNYTILQYFSITKDNKKQSPTYYYKNENTYLYTTILNTTEVRDNHQNITIIGNKPGIIHYTKDGTTPTNTSKIYTPGQTMDINIKTQLKTVLVDKKQRQSEVNFYQAPQIVTPPVTVIKAKTMLVNNIQTIQFETNMANSTIYYTTDKTDPQNSKTRKTVKTGTQIKINKNTQLKYYTDNNGYHSAVYTYTPPKSNNERPTITIYNTTRMYSNGQQRIMIQTNQPGTIYYIKYTDDETPVKYTYTGEITTTKNNKLIIYATSTTQKTSKMIEYTSATQKTVMNYTYMIKIPENSRYIGINTFDSNLINSDFLTLYNVINYDKKIKEATNSYYIPEYMQGISLYKDNQNTIIRIHDITYGDINQVSIIYDSLYEGFEKITVLTNKQIQYQIYITQNQQYTATGIEKITTQFRSNYITDSINKTEIITYGTKGKNSNGFESIQTYTLTNKIINSNIIKQVIKEKPTINGMEKAAYGTYLTGLTTIYFNDMTSSFYSCYYNVTFNRESDTAILTGVNINEATYVTLTDPTLATEILTGNKTNSIQFRLMTTLMLSECERMAIMSANQTVQYSALNDFYKNLIQHPNNLTIEYDNNTHIMTIVMDKTRYFFDVDWNTGIVKTLMNTTITYYGETISDTLKGNMGMPNQGGCYHGDKTDFLSNTLEKLFDFLNNVTDAAKTDIDNMLNNPSDELKNTLEDMGGSMAITAGVMLIVGSGGLATPIGVALIIGGSAACFNAAGVNSIDDLTDSQKFLQGAMSVTMSLVGCGEAKAAMGAVKITSSTINKETGKTFIKATAKNSGYGSIKKAGKTYVKGKVQSWGATGFYNFYSGEKANGE